MNKTIFLVSRKMPNYNCKNGCCIISVNDYKHDNTSYNRERIPRKAGALIYDPEERRVLLVQSRGKYWGIPKGTLEISELDKECAVREIYEETGLIVNPREFKKITRVKDRAVYFYLERKVCPVTIQEHVGNDANGITWIKIDCLEELINSGNISLNSHTKLVLARFLDKIFPKVEFTRVERRRRRCSI